MVEPYPVRFPVRLTGHDFGLMAQAYSRRGINIEEELEIERKTAGREPLAFTYYVIRGLKEPHPRQT